MSGPVVDPLLPKDEGVIKAGVHASPEGKIVDNLTLGSPKIISIKNITPPI